MEFTQWDAFEILSQFCQDLFEQGSFSFSFLVHAREKVQFSDLVITHNIQRMYQEANRCPGNPAKEQRDIQVKSHEVW